MSGGGESPPEREEAPPRAWSFWLLVVLTALYLGWRLVQGIGWLANRVFG